MPSRSSSPQSQSGPSASPDRRSPARRSSARARGFSPGPPRGRADLPFASELARLPAHRLAPEGDYELVVLGGAGEGESGAIDDPDARGARFLECAFDSTDVDGGRLRGSRFNDVWLGEARWVGTDLSESSWLDCEFNGGLLAGAAMYGARMQRVVFHRCKLDAVNLRQAGLREVVFADCVLREVDLREARLERVSFPGSTLEAVRLAGIRAERLDLRGVRGLGIADGLESLRGAVVSPAQLIDLAPALAEALGITVEEAP